jgi:hypothetical protein
MKKFFTYLDTNVHAPKPLMSPIGVQQQKEILLKWIRSCRTAEQLDLLAEIVTEFVVKRFSDKTEFYEMELAKRELSDAIIEQRVITARERQPMRLNTHLLVIPNESYYCLS